MARTVADAAILLGAMTGIDADDPVTLDSKGKTLKDYTPFLDPAGLKGKRIGIEKAALNGHEGVVALFQASIELLKAQGATIVEVELVKQMNDPGSVEGLILQYEFKDGLNRYLAAAGAKPKSLADIIAFNKENAKKAMPYFQQETLERSESRGSLDSAEYTDALKKLLTTRKIIDDLLKQEQLDAIAAPTNGMACCIDLASGDYRTGFSFSGPAAMAGYPHITVPMGLVFGLPVGISFVGTAYAEPELLKMAYAFEQASKKRTAPSFMEAANPSL
jgi:amidase